MPQAAEIEYELSGPLWVAPSYAAFPFDGMPPARRLIRRPLLLTGPVGTFGFSAFLGDDDREACVLGWLQRGRAWVWCHASAAWSISPTHPTQLGLLRIHAPLPFQPGFDRQPLR